MRNVSFLILGLAVSASACKKQSKDGDKAGSGAPKVTPGSGSAVASGSAAVVTPPTAPPADTGPKGLAANTNDAAVVAIAQKSKDCKIDPAYPKNGCTDVVKELAAKTDDTTLPTIINLLEERTDTNVRFVAARVLLDKMVLQGAKGRTFGARVAAAVTAETDPATAAILGEAALQGDFADAAYAGAIGTALSASKLPEMRSAIASNLAAADEAHGTDLVIAQFGKETDPKVKVALVGGLYLARDAAKVCPFLLSAMKDSDDAVAGEAGYGLVWSDGKCKDSYDAFVEAYAARTGKVDFTYALKTVYMAEAKQATDAQKAKYFDVIKKQVEDTGNSGMARAKLLETLVKHAPDGKAFASKFTKDADSFVAEQAKKAK